MRLTYNWTVGCWIQRGPLPWAVEIPKGFSIDLEVEYLIATCRAIWWRYDHGHKNWVGRSFPVGTLTDDWQECLEGKK